MSAAARLVQRGRMTVEVDVQPRVRSQVIGVTPRHLSTDWRSSGRSTPEDQLNNQRNVPLLQRSKSEGSGETEHNKRAREIAFFLESLWQHRISQHRQ